MSATVGPAISDIESIYPQLSGPTHRDAQTNINAALRHKAQEQASTGWLGVYQLTKTDKLWIAVMFFNFAVVIMQVIVFFMYPCKHPFHITALTFGFNACFILCLILQWRQTRNRVHSERPAIT